MGWSLPSHIDQGVIFGALGLWHLANSLFSFAKSSKDFRYRTWFPVNLRGSLRCVELWTLLLIVVVFIIKQLSRASSDFKAGTIQMEHMQRYQHVTFALFFFIYAVVGLLSENSKLLPLPDGALQANFALGFAVELLIFRLGHHPGDTLESFVHTLMQIILALLVSLMLTEMLMPRSFLVSVARCMVLVFKGTWFFHIGLLINSDLFVPAGCIRGPHDFPVCDNHEAYMRARSLQVLFFGLHIAGILIFTYLSYAILVHAQGFFASNTQYHKVETVEPVEESNGVPGVPFISIVPRSLSRRFSGTNGDSPLRKKTMSPTGIGGT